MAKLLILDSERSIRNSLKDRLEYEGYQIELAESHQKALSVATAANIDIVICDHELFDGMHEAADGRVLLGYPTIVLSQSSSIDQVVNVIKRGAIGFIAKPIDMNRLYAAIREALSERTPHTPSRVEIPSRTFACRDSSVEEIVGESSQIKLVKSLICKVAPSEARVLITGANGTGKELVARWLHEKSRRRSNPFVEVNCAAIPSELIESELFGHEKGAFTSAVKQRKGKFEQADGGTLFLDEIGDMSLSAQAKVLRALQENKISRVGSDKDLEVNVRVVAATNKNLQHEIAVGNFREDLYHRLSVIVIKVPPLSQRKDDIPLLINHFIDKISAEYHVSRKSIEPEAIEELKAMAWTGNIRELRNVIERLIILSGNSITLDDVVTYAVACAL